MATTQQHIDELITTIFYATQDRSVTNVMVGRVLDWLNKRAGQLQSEIESGRRECVKEYEEINRAIASIRETLKGVSTVANSAYGRADTNARSIGQITSRINAMIQQLLKSGCLPQGWGDGLVQGNSGVSEYVDRGTWQSGASYYAGTLNELTGVIETSYVWYMGCKYRCLTSGTGSAPLWNSPDWEFVEGDPEPHIVFTGTDDPTIAFGETKEIGCRVYIYNQDATADVADWEIERDTGSATEDTAWGMKEKAKDFDGSIGLTYASEDDDLGYAGRAVFRVKAYLDGGAEASGELEF